MKLLYMDSRIIKGNIYHNKIAHKICKTPIIKMREINNK